MKMKQWWIDFLKGGSFGLGVVPGGDAGTMAIVVGIYKKLIDNLAGLRKNFKQCLFNLIPIGLGAVVAAFILIVGVNYGYEFAPFAFTALFAGIVFGSLPSITKEVKFKNLKAPGWLRISLGITAAILIGVFSIISKVVWKIDLEANFLNGDWWTYIVALIVGFVAAAACFLPGVSGSMILHIFGVYSPTVGIFLGDNSIFHNPERLGSGIGIATCLLVGIFLGVFGTANAMQRLLSKHKDGTFQVILGFVLGSLVAMFANQDMFAIVDGSAVWIGAISPWWEYLLAAGLFIAFSIIFHFVSLYVMKKEKAEALATQPQDTDAKN